MTGADPSALTRRRLLAAGAAPAIAVALSSAAPPANAHGLAETADAERLARVHRIAALSAYVYQQVLAEHLLRGSRLRAIAGFLEQERAHAAALAAAVHARGGQTTPGPRSVATANAALRRHRIRGRLGQLHGPEGALELLIETERVGIGSCYVAVPRLTGPSAITLVAQIMASDAQHEALLSFQRHALNLAAATQYGLVSGSH